MQRLIKEHALLRLQHAPTALTSKVNSIAIPDDGVLVFVFKDGTERTVNWENRSRRESWTDEMKQTAREQALRGGKQDG